MVSMDVLSQTTPDAASKWPREEAFLKLQKHDICFSKANPTPRIYAQGANFAEHFHFLCMTMFLCVGAGQAILAERPYVKATRASEMLFDSRCFAALVKNTLDNAQITICPAPGFTTGQWRALGNFQRFCLARAEKPGVMSTRLLNGSATLH